VNRPTEQLQLRAFQSRNLKPLDLSLQAGECVTLGGPSGCGKSLLLRAIADLDPHQGEASCGSHRQSQTPPPAWRRMVALLPAESHWWADSVGEHMPDVDPALLAALGFSTETLEWQISRLSSGERQRLSLVRLLSIHPRVLLLDEPTANLDQASGAQVEALVGRYLEEQAAAALWVSHDPRQRKRLGSRSFLISDGDLTVETCN
jgi:ABC-type iron transport system FetAB ATPase subunit